MRSDTKGGQPAAEVTVDGVLGSLGLLKRPDKTFVGRTGRGFDSLGYRFGPEGFTLAAKTVERFVARAHRLYERQPGEALASARLGLYVRRWVGWADRPSMPTITVTSGRLARSSVAPPTVPWLGSNLYAKDLPGRGQRK